MSKAGAKGKKNLRKVRSPRRGGSKGFIATLAAISLAGVGLIIQARADNQEAAALGPSLGDHWHVPFGINICGKWQPNVPEFESTKGIHSHDDGYIHMHPFTSAGANKEATIGLYLDQAPKGYKVTETSIKVAGKTYKNGDKCKNLDNQKARVKWSVNDKEQPFSTDAAEYVPDKDGNVVAIAFLPDDEEIGVPPSVKETPVNDGATPVTTPAGDDTTSTTEGGESTTSTSTSSDDSTSSTTAGDEEESTTSTTEKPTTSTTKKSGTTTTTGKSTAPTGDEE